MRDSFLDMTSHVSIEIEQDSTGGGAEGSIGGNSTCTGHMTKWCGACGTVKEAGRGVGRTNHGPRRPMKEAQAHNEKDN